MLMVAIHAGVLEKILGVPAPGDSVSRKRTNHCLVVLITMVTRGMVTLSGCTRM